jgi:glycosyltransferase involved in cell wall biosynthesis
MQIENQCKEASVEMKKILIDCTALQGRSWDRGIGKYAESLITNLINSDKQHYGYLISTFSEIRPLYEVIKYLKQFAEMEDIHIWPYNSELAKEVTELERESFVKSLSYDEVLIIDLFEARHHIPISINKFHQIPTSVILHDLIPFEDPKTYLSNKHDAKIYCEAISDLKNANMIFCNSHYSHNSLVSNFEMLADRAHFVGGGPNNVFRKLDLEKKNQVICILGDDPRKNVDNLITAWSQLPEDILESYKLKIVGNFSNERIDFYMRNLSQGSISSNSIVFTGSISDSELEIELNVSMALFHPALSEGLGLPILEAIVVGVPAISSKNTAMKEIARGGALLDPEDLGSIQLYLENTIRDVGFRNQVIYSQMEVLETYNWVSVSSKIAAFMEKKNQTKHSVDSNHNFLMDKKKTKIACIAPSMSSKTGIARFSDCLLPFLEEFASVDFIPTESIADMDETLSLMESYDKVFIQLGNSPHHKNAFKLAANFPSIILCHDIKFGNTLKNLHGEDKEWMPELEALSLLEGDHLEIIGLSRILNLALGVIVQSETATNLLQQLGIPKAKIKKVQFPSMFSVQSKEFEVDRSKNFTEIVSAGFITPNKGYEILIDAISIFNRENSQNIVLKLVGEAGADYSKVLFTWAESRRVDLEITGYLDGPTYLKELSKSQLAVQLRTTDSGEASAAVSDLLSFGVPTIVNNIGAFKDLPDNVVRKVTEFPDSSDIARALGDLKLFEVRNAISRSAKVFIEDFAKPQKWAEEVFNFIQTRYQLDLVNNARKYSSIVSKRELYPLIALLQSVEKTDASFGYSFKIGSDVSNLKNTKFVSGIQRATLEIHRNLHKPTVNSRYFFSGVTLSGDLDATEPPHPQIAKDFLVSGVQNRIENLDALLLVDLNFHFFESQSFKDLAQRGTPIIANVYDVLPITNPEWFPPGSAKNLFVPWINSVLKYSSDIIVNSEATHVELKNLKQFSSFKGRVHVAPLGISNDFQRVQAERVHFRTLLVGTIEPRKGHEDALNAFDQLHARGILAELHIVGRQGWMVESVITRITSHNLYNKKLFWHNECSDVELNQLYGTSQVTLVTSKGEGFGLPLIEALSQGSKVVARDIPVFREIGQQSVIFFDSHASNLADVWIDALCDIGEVNQEPIPQNNGYRDYARSLKSILEERLEWYFEKLSSS